MHVKEKGSIKCFSYHTGTISANSCVPAMNHEHVLSTDGYMYVVKN